jgi:Fe2+ or Zn2+ uptake regulation protein
VKPLETLLDQLHQNGLRVTPQRRAILKLLVDDENHPTAAQIYERLVSTMPDISRATVYNTLRELSDLGELKPIHDLHEGVQRYDTNNEVHHHLYCIQCDRLIDLAHDFEGLDLAPEEKSGYQILSHQVTFYGICPDCQTEKG